MLTLLRDLRTNGVLGLYAVLGASGAASIALLAFRVHQYDTIQHGFLAWNLFLAAIPFAISQWLALGPTRAKGALFAGLFLWLLFLPNAPYLVTDLKHIARPGPAPLLFDVVLLASFAWNGLMLGHLSLLAVHRVVERDFGRRAGWAFTGGSIVLCSLGIYIGRYLRWNSWDVFTQPAHLLSDVLAKLTNPAGDPNVYGVIVLFSAFLMGGYLLLCFAVQTNGLAAMPARLEGDEG